MTIIQAAELMGVSTKTVRRFIKAGKVQAQLLPGPFGEEYHITHLPPEMLKSKDNGESSPDNSDGNGKRLEQTPRQAAESEKPARAIITSPFVQEPVIDPQQVMNLLKDLQEKNMVLAAQLGAAAERLRNLENQVKLIAPTASPKLPWWKRLFHIK